MEIHRTTIPGHVPIRWHERGDGYPTVLVHGLPTGPALWRHVARNLTSSRVLAFEMLGYAESMSAGRNHDISVAAQADHLNAWLEELGIERAVLVGHDLGGGVVQIAAARQPQRCAGLVLVDAIAYDSWPIGLVAAMQQAAPVLSRLPWPLVAAAVRRTVLDRGHDDDAEAREAAVIHLRHYAEQLGASGLAMQVTSLDVEDTLAVADRLPHLGVPSAVVWGARDPFQHVRYAHRLAEDLGAQLTLVDAESHFIPEDHPDPVVRAIDGVVSAASGRR